MQPRGANPTFIQILRPAAAVACVHFAVLYFAAGSLMSVISISLFTMAYMVRPAGE